MATPNQDPPNNGDLIFSTTVANPTKEEKENEKDNCKHDRTSQFHATDTIEHIE
jgi:hypothetical protein